MDWGSSILATSENLRLTRSKGAKGAIKQVPKQQAVSQTLVEQGANKKRLQINGGNPKRKCSREPSLTPPPPPLEGFM